MYVLWVLTKASTILYIHHCSTTQNSLTALKLSRASPTPLSLSLSPTTDHYTFLYICFFNNAYSWNHKVCSFFRSASYTNDMHLHFPHVYYGLLMLFLFGRCYYCLTFHYLCVPQCINLLKDIFVVSQFCFVFFPILNIAIINIHV